MKNMKVKERVYTGQCGADGMFDSLSSLKAPNMEHYQDLPPYAEAVCVYNNILKLAINWKKDPSYFSF